ncbi:6370_t:CDS:10 [Diversispora eburnea]|uniref:6370_t:CDS:1 n=1 Tax=Diversispora eburnea TaxID=1213867 RepID=A0A9N8WGD5_9GLOM|nr:6370_t:CDS:10 [Diversispora eburnea]
MPLPDTSLQKAPLISTQAEPHVITRTKAKQPNRTTKTSQKLALFPEEQVSVVDEIKDDKYNQIGQIPQGTARKEAEKFSKQERLRLPRVTAYCTASSYKMDNLIKYLQSLRIRNNTSPKRIDECIYTPFAFHPPKPPSTADLLGINEISPSQEQSIPEIFYFEYGVVVIWGMKEGEEKNLLHDLASFEDEKLAASAVETEEFHYHYAASYQPRIYNDVITLKNPGNYMVKLAISHAIAQSVKMTLFEELIEDTIEATKHIPQTMAETGKVLMSRTAITRKIGQLFIMRINVNLVSNVLDTPEIFWSEPAYEPLYTAIRGYLEISRQELYLGDLLDMLKEHLTSSHGEHLEWIVIVLIAFEIVIGVITILIDFFAYSTKEGF